MPMRLDLPPPPTVLPRGGGGSDWVTLLRAPNDIEAHLLAGRLHEAGIATCAVKDRDVPAWLFGGSNPWAPVLVMVRRLQLEDARVVLAEISWEAPAAAPQRSVHDRMHPVIWWAAAIALGVFFTALGLSQAQRYMDSCTGTRCAGSPSVLP